MPRFHLTDEEEGLATPELVEAELEPCLLSPRVVLSHQTLHLHYIHLVVSSLHLI